MPVWPWGGHRGWAYDLVRFVRPGVICELGVHWGTSLFAFAQAVKDAGLASRLIGVDTWEGDGHTGPYGPDVLRTVREIAAASFAGQTLELLPMSFDEALPKVSPGSIDLLHIDGFHEYDSVKRDFESWLPTLATDGIVLLHDVADDTGYGSARYWKELLERHPGFQFPHSWGLGVVFPKGDKWLRRLREQGLDDKVPLYTYRAQLERAMIELRDTGELAVSRMGVIEDMGRMIRQAKERERALEEQVANQVAEARAAAALAVERLAAIDEMGLTIYRQHQQEVAIRGELESVQREIGSVRADLTAAGAMAADRLAAMKELERRLLEHRQREAQTNAEVERLRAAGEHWRREGEAAGALAAERLAAMEGLEGRVLEHQQREARACEEIERQGRDLERSRLEQAAAAALAAERLSEVERMERAIRELEAARERLSGDLESSAALLRRVEARAAELESMLAGETSRAAGLQLELAEKHAMIEELKKSMEVLRADVELIALRLEHLERVEIEREESREEARTRRGETVSARAGRKGS